MDLWTRRGLIAILRRGPKYIPWPTQLERLAISSFFKDNYGIPHCVGLMDGCHINLCTAPARRDAGSFHSWKRRYGILIVAIADQDYRIRYIHYGYPASASDHRVQRAMEVFTEHGRFFGPSEYVLADSGFTSTPHAVPMFTKRRGDDRLRGRAAYFNIKAAPARVRVEQTFGVLKGRFSSLRSLGQRLKTRQDQARAHGFIIAAAICHNLFLNFHPTSAAQHIPHDDDDDDTSMEHHGHGDEDVDGEDLDRGTAGQRVSRRETLINQMLELDDDEWDLDTLEWS